MLKNKVALVTGGARGIGNAISRALAKEGYAIAVMDIIDEKNVTENFKEIKECGSSFMYVKGDIALDSSRKEVVENIMDKFGRIDVLVNNAGVAPKVRMDILETTEESMDFVLGINLKGTFFLTQLISNIMINELGSNSNMNPKIINISSISAYTSSTIRGEYCISKAGVSMVTALFADRLAEYGINVYEIRPGIIMTDMTKKVKNKYNKLIEEGITPIKRWGYPEDIGNAVSVLCSDKLNFSTGEIINVDGGFHIRRV